MILVYPGQNASLEKLKTILKDQDVYYLTDDQFDQTLEQLIQKAKENQQYPPLEALKSQHDQTLLYGIDISADELLVLQSEAKAIACLETPNNHKMRLADLYQEAAQEDLYFQKREELTNLLEKVDPKALQANRDYFQCYALACALLRQDELSFSMLETALNVMRSFEKQ